uniref:Pentraxin family member n=1 Tax=Callorhinchus milii TaxID=7868 RepID=K4GLE0_CALMI|nr:c-reactive protein-like isoform 1 [Callorhinchus milii]
MKSLLLIVASCLLSGLASADEDRQGLIGESLIFSTPSDTNHVLLTPSRDMDLKNFTLCLRVNTESPRQHVLFSYATQSSPSELLLKRGDETTVSLTVSGVKIPFLVRSSQLSSWVHVCARRDMMAKQVILHINGRPSVRKALEPSNPIKPGGKVVLGQEQGRVGGGFQQEKCLVGEIADVHLWDHILTTSTIRAISMGDPIYRGNVIDWLTVKHTIKGQVKSLRTTSVN